MAQWGIEVMASYYTTNIVSCILFYKMVNKFFFLNFRKVTNLDISHTLGQFILQSAVNATVCVNVDLYEEAVERGEGISSLPPILVLGSEAAAPPLPVQAHLLYRYLNYGEILSGQP